MPLVLEDSAACARWNEASAHAISHMLMMPSLKLDLRGSRDLVLNHRIELDYVVGTTDQKFQVVVQGPLVPVADETVLPPVLENVYVGVGEVYFYRTQLLNA